MHHMKNLLPLVFLLSNLAFGADVLVTIPRETLENLSHLPDIKMTAVQKKGFASFQTTSDNLDELSQLVHEKQGHCGGFLTSFTEQIHHQPTQVSYNTLSLYELSKGDQVREYLQEVSENRIFETIEWFSSYPTRYYTTKTGIKAMEDLAVKWRNIVKDLSFAKVELVHHQKWKQPSVVLTLTGIKNDVIIIGGHGDSINTDENTPLSHAPGADDNASGISVITEVIKVLSLKGYQPQNTIKFMAYAAEEVGLLGSMDLALKYQEAKIPVKGVLQFDGTNYRGSKQFEMVLISDGTDQVQNKFLGMLLDTYLKIRWSYDKCGYACSDHYSWTYHGFPASFPAEAKVREENPHIHTAEDTLSVSNNSAAHSVNFAKLGIAYVLELDK